MKTIYFVKVGEKNSTNYKLAMDRKNVDLITKK